MERNHMVDAQLSTLFATLTELVEIIIAKVKEIEPNPKKEDK